MVIPLLRTVQASNWQLKKNKVFLDDSLHKKREFWNKWCIYLGISYEGNKKNTLYLLLRSLLKVTAYKLKVTTYILFLGLIYLQVPCGQTSLDFCLSWLKHLK